MHDRSMYHMLAASSIGTSGCLTYARLLVCPGTYIHTYVRKYAIDPSPTDSIHACVRTCVCRRISMYTNSRRRHHIRLHTARSSTVRTYINYVGTLLYVFTCSFLHRSVHAFEINNNNYWQAYATLPPRASLVGYLAAADRGKKKEGANGLWIGD